jgi:serpin B
MKSIARMAAVCLLAVATLASGGAAALAKDGCPSLAPVGVTLLSALAEQVPDRNLLVSPYGVAAAMAMVWHGADAAGKADIEQALGFTPSGAPGMASGAPGALGPCLPVAEAGSRPAVAVANAAWLAPTLHPGAAWRNRLETEAGAEVQPLHGDAGDVARINAWVAAATNNRIASVLSTLPGDAALALVNAVHFKGGWANPFAADASRTAEFHHAGGGAEPVTMMSLSGTELPYLEDDTAQAVALPFVGQDWHLVVIVPKGDAVTPAGTWLPRVKPGWLTGAGFAPATGSVTLPRLDLALQAQLLPLLRRRGLELDGHLGDIATPAPRLTEVVHGATLRIDEQGAEAAAATAVIAARSLNTRPPFTLVADRPFVVSLANSKTGLLLFLGAIERPGAK